MSRVTDVLLDITDVESVIAHYAYTHYRDECLDAVGEKAIRVACVEALEYYRAGDTTLLDSIEISLLMGLHVEIANIMNSLQFYNYTVCNIHHLDNTIHIRIN